MACGEPEYATGAGPAESQATACSEDGVPPDVVRELGLEGPFYAQACSAFGIPVLASEHLPRSTLELATDLVAGVLAAISPDLRDAIHDRYFRVVIVATTTGESFADVPELSDLRQAELAAAGLGPDPAFPAATMRDSVLLCRPIYRDPGATPPGDTLIHELGHTVLSMGLEPTQPGFRQRLDDAFAGALQLARWQAELTPAVEARYGSELATPYLMTNADEYWATGVSTWFGFAAIPIQYALAGDGTSLRVESLHGRTALSERDPLLAALLTEVFGPEPNLQHHCPAWFPDPGR